MSNKAVSLLLLSTLSVLSLSACSNDSTEEAIKTPELKSSIDSEPKTDDSDLQQDLIEQTDLDTNPTDLDTKYKAVAMSSDEGVLGAKQAEAFQSIYTATCMQYLLKLDELRGNLKAEPKFPTEQASQLLAGDTGSAWPVPADSGSFILAIPDDKNLCAIYAKDLDTQLTNQQFIDIYSKPPSPLTATQIDNITVQRGEGVKTTLSYSWFIPDIQKKMLFMLTTDDSGSTDVKAMYTASIMPE